MEEDLRTSPELGYFIDSDNANYFSGLSTILVATIQEVKDRVSQIEYIFCCQLFPNFQSRSQSLQKKFGEAMKAAEDNWRKKENYLLLQIKELQHEKQQAFEKYQQLLGSLEQVKAKLVKDESRKAAEDEWRKKESCLLLQMEELQLEMHQALEEKHCLVASLEQEKEKLKIKEQLLNEHEMEKKLLLAGLESLEQNAEAAELQGKLEKKNEEVAEGKRMLSKLHRKMELKDYEMLIEKKKRIDFVDSYKRLKAQHNFVCRNIGLSPENLLSCSKMEEQSNLPRLHHNPGFVSNRKEPKDETNLQIKV